MYVTSVGLLPITHMFNIALCRLTNHKVSLIYLQLFMLKLLNQMTNLCLSLRCISHVVLDPHGNYEPIPRYVVS